MARYGRHLLPRSFWIGLPLCMAGALCSDHFWNVAIESGPGMSWMLPICVLKAKLHYEIVFLCRVSGLFLSIDHSLDHLSWKGSMGSNTRSRQEKAEWHMANHQKFFKTDHSDPNIRNILNDQLLLKQEVNTMSKKERILLFAIQFRKFKIDDSQVLASQDEERQRPLCDTIAWVDKTSWFHPTRFLYIGIPVIT